MSQKILRSFFVILAGLFVILPIAAKAEQLAPPNLVEVRLNDQFVDKNAVTIASDETLDLIGTAEPGSEVFLYIYSELPLIAKTNTDKDGNWQYVLNQSLSAGSHRIEAETHLKDEISAKTEVLNFTVEKKVVMSQTIYYLSIALLLVLLLILLFYKRKLILKKS